MFKFLNKKGWRKTLIKIVQRNFPENQINGQEAKTFSAFLHSRSQLHD